ncbi:MAG: hypothetical protein JXR77_07095, partial [Lentisphaeria bacterium]|nr:hypothetical protein [Lentisphaeria bacterium]
VLFSDGNSNHGSAPVEIAKQYRSRGIPVSCVGIGEPREPGDVRVRFGRPPAPPRKGDLVVLPVQVENRFPRPVTTRLTLADAGGPLDTRTLTVPAGETLDETFTTEAWRAGFLTYTVRMDAVTDDSRPDNDVDFLGLEVREPDTFRILYVAAHLGWEYRFLKILADGNRQLSLAAVIRLGENSFYKTDFSGEEEADAKGNGFPESPAALNRYEAILLDSRAAVEWSAPGIEALVSFVDRRGGGLLLVGPPDALPQPLRDLLPAQALAPDALRRQERLEANPEFVFDADPTRVLADPPGLPLVAGEELWLVREPKRGARMAAGIRHTEKGFLAAQSYGSGRTAYLGLESSWRWSLRDATGERGHRAFWNSLLVWLASSSRQRVRIASDGAKTGVGDPLVLDADILDTDFRPAADAKVTATVLSPSGTATEVALDPSVATPGRYGGVFFPDESGEYRVDYRIGIGDREERTQTHFVARRQGIETEETPYREDVLRDVARITGGAFLPYSRMAALAEGIPLSTHVPMRTSRTYWSDNALLLLLLVLVLGAEWYLRRRLGLR